MAFVWQTVSLLQSEIHQLKAEVLQWKTVAEQSSQQQLHMSEQEQKQLSRLRNLYGGYFCFFVRVPSYVW